MNVSANIIIGASHFIPPGWNGWTLKTTAIFCWCLALLGFRTLVILLISPFGGWLRVFNGEFDSGSGRTL
ncbi:hypothetical protein, partial [Nocardia sp. XZ_19_385]|uniref:hypothetical protein n=1 Tax=Nocardia sp. XZ_19_385 TaxID=2769488 RepID=UPI001E37C39E